MTITAPQIAIFYRDRGIALQSRVFTGDTIYGFIERQ
jgi:hypothetical protein